MANQENGSNITILRAIPTGEVVESGSLHRDVYHFIDQTSLPDEVRPSEQLPANQWYSEDQDGQRTLHVIVGSDPALSQETIFQAFKQKIKEIPLFQKAKLSTPQP